jgi:hypothetical protein
MNQYGAQARRHWKTHLPDRYSQIPDPETFFAELGDQIAELIQATAMAIAGPDPTRETYLQKVGRLNMARLSAEEQVLREMLPNPESDLTIAG